MNHSRTEAPATAPPRVLFICSALRTGGAERQWSILVPSLAARGFAPHVVALRGGGRFFDDIRAAGVEIECAGLRSRYDVARIARVVRSARSDPPDLVVTQEINAHVVGALVAASCRVPHIGIEHTPSGLPRKLHRRLLSRLVARRLDALVAVGEAQVTDLTRLGFRREAISVIANGIPELKPERSRYDVRAELGVDQEAFVALLVATLRPQKRAHLFVSAIATAYERDAGVVGVVAGGGPDLDAIRSLAGRSGGAVTMLGERQDVADLVNAADAVCFTSVSEGLPMAALEAMSLARPIVAMAVPGIEEAVVDGETGVLVPSGDVDAFAVALRELRRDPAVARRLGEGGRRRFDRLYWADRMVDDYANLFRRVLGVNGTTRRVGSS